MNRETPAGCDCPCLQEDEQDSDQQTEQSWMPFETRAEWLDVRHVSDPHRLAGIGRRTPDRLAGIGHRTPDRLADIGPTNPDRLAGISHLDCQSLRHEAATRGRIVLPTITPTGGRGSLVQTYFLAGRRTFDRPSSNNRTFDRPSSNNRTFDRPSSNGCTASCGARRRTSDPGERRPLEEGTMTSFDGSVPRRSRTAPRPDTLRRSHVQTPPSVPRERFHHPEHPVAAGVYGAWTGAHRENFMVARTDISTRTVAT